MTRGNINSGDSSQSEPVVFSVGVCVKRFPRESPFVEDGRNASRHEGSEGRPRWSPCAIDQYESNGTKSTGEEISDNWYATGNYRQNHTSNCSCGSGAQVFKVGGAGGKEAFMFNHLNMAKLTYEVLRLAQDVYCHYVANEKLQPESDIQQVAQSCIALSSEFFAAYEALRR
jgi:hypothetical protein